MSGAPPPDLHADCGGLSDEAWRDLWLAHARGEATGRDLPDFPPEEIQRRFVGTTQEGTIREAFAFYLHLRALARTRGRPLQADDAVLDFGCGWGRFLRLLSRDVPPERLHGVDVQPSILERCRLDRVPGRLEAIDPFGRLPVDDGALTLGMAYSVFTHLPERVHLHWKAELARAMAPGAVFVFTVQPRRFLDTIRRLDRAIHGPRLFGVRLRPSRDPATGNREWQRALASFAPRLEELTARYDRGELVFLTDSSDPDPAYGDALAPLSFIEARWAPDFEVIDHVDDRSRFEQAVVAVRRR